MRPLLVIVLLAAVAVPCIAQTFHFGDFSNTSTLTLNGSAAVNSGTVLRLTPSTFGQAASVYMNTPQTIASAFETTFTFQITNPVVQFSNGADGITFIFQNDPTGLAAIGATGGSIGYVGITNCLVIEFDTWLSNHPSGVNDLSANEISVHANGTGASSNDESFSLGSVTPTVTMADGAVHTVLIRYVPGTLQIFLDNMASPVLTVPWDFNAGGNWFSSGTFVPGMSLINSTDAYVGFTAATGGDAQTHDILSWSWNGATVHPCYAGNAGGDLLLVNGSNGGFFRTETILFGQPVTIDVLQPPSNPNPAPFLVFGMVGHPTPAFLTTLPIGDMCFPPYLLQPVSPLFFLADSFSTTSGAFFAAPPTPWSLTLPPLNFPFQFALQGVVQHTNTPTNNLALTNTVLADIVPAAPPAISGVTPLADVAGNPITVNGTGFHPSAILMVAGSAVTPTSISANQIVFPMPAGLPCDVTVDVVNPDGQTSSTPFNPTPAVTNTVFGSGPAAGGANFIVIGSGFTPGSTVTIGGGAATITAVNPSSIVMTTPPGSVGTATVVVTSASGCTATTTYTYM